MAIAVHQCSGALLLAKLGILGRVPTCTDLTTKPWVQEAAESALHYVAPVGEKDEYVSRAMKNIAPYLFSPRY
jgi:hypothetical protein